MREWLRPHRMAYRLADVDSRELAARGVCGVLIDLDNTLTPWRSLEIPPEALAWVRELSALGLRACIVSNAATDRRVRPVAEQIGVPWITRAAKPLPGGFHRAMTLLRTTPDTTAIIGDQVFTDILGGNRLGLFTVLVEPMSAREAIITCLLQRPLERLVGRVPKTPLPAPTPRE